MATYKNLLRTAKVPSGRYTHDDLLKLFETLSEINREVQKYELEDVFPGIKAKDPKYDESDIQKEISEKLLLRVGIYGSDGFYKVTEDSRQLSRESLPKTITKLVFENTSWYKVILNREQLNTFEVILDFSPPPVWDLISHPSNATSNHSSIKVLGDESTWVEGSFNKIKAALNPGLSLRSFIHASGAYDIILWLLVVPTTASYFVSLERKGTLPFSNISDALMAVIYLVGILFCLVIFRIFFNVLRSGFPIVEYEGNTSKGFSLQRIMTWILATFSGAILSWIAVEAFRFLLNLLISKT